MKDKFWCRHIKFVPYLDGSLRLTVIGKMYHDAAARKANAARWKGHKPNAMAAQWGNLK
jgi:hypothetical protein